MGLGKSLKKVAKTVSHVVKKDLGAVAGLAVGGPLGALAGKGIQSVVHTLSNKPKLDQGDPNQAANEQLQIEQRANDEQAKREALGVQQRNQIGAFARDFGISAGDYRKQLAQNLAQTGGQLFQQENPFILQDLNNRGLFTSQSAVNDAQAQALSQIAADNNRSLSSYDTDIFDQTQDILGSGLSASLGGDQSGLDAALGLRRKALQRTFDLHDQDREQRLSDYLAKTQKRNQLVGSLIGAGAGIGGAILGGPIGAGIGSTVGSTASSLNAPWMKPGTFPTPGTGLGGYQNSGNSFSSGNLSLY